jgi:hypothetical protein
MAPAGIFELPGGTMTSAAMAGEAAQIIEPATRTVAAVTTRFDT